MLRIEVCANVATITLARPSSGNALHQQLVDQLLNTVNEVVADKDVEVLLLKSDLPEFCVGGDLRYIYSDKSNIRERLDSLVRPWHETILSLANCPKLIVTEVNGAVAGGGLGLIAVADLVYASDKATFMAGFNKLGLTCDSGLSWFLPRIIGLKRAKSLLLGHKPISSATALSWGLVDEVFAHDELSNGVLREVELFSQIPYSAQKKIKQLLFTTGPSLAEHLSREREIIVNQIALNKSFGSLVLKK